MKRGILILALIVLILVPELAAAFLADGNDTVYTVDARNKNLVHMEIRDSLGLLVEQGRLLNYKKEGVFRYYNDQNIIIKIQEFHEGNADGVNLLFGRNCALEVEENFQSNLLQGRRVVYRFGGIRKSLENYDKGKLDGVKIAFYQSGYKQEEAAYRAGVRDGLSVWFNEREEVTIEYYYRNGSLNGPAKMYHYNTKLQQEGNYVNDLEEGQWNYYDENGKLSKSVFYKNGKVIREKLY